MKSDIVIISACRTPFGRFGGALKDIDVYDLAAIAMKECLERVNIDKKKVTQVFWGVGDTSQCKDVYTPVLARQALLKAGMAAETTSLSLDKACVSGTSAVQLGIWALRLGEADIALCGGSNSFSREPLIYRGSRWNGFRIGDLKLDDPLFELGYRDYNPVAVDAGEVALEYGITREEQDEWAFYSHKKYGEAHAAGKFKDEMIRMEMPQKKGDPIILEIDEQYRPNVSLERLAALPTIYGSPTITAGNAPGLNDGACAVLIATREKAKELGCEPIATLVDITNAALDPRMIAAVPAPSIEKVLKRNNLALKDMKVIEINEAFAAMPLV